METASLSPLFEPPSILLEVKGWEWMSLPEDDPVIRYLAESHWTQARLPEAWLVARGSHAVGFYRETSTGWTVVAKFYVLKTGPEADRHARRELEGIQQAWKASAGGPDGRPVRPLGVHQGVLFLEYVDGLNLDDVIAVRRSRPGTLLGSLTAVGRFLAGLHTRSQVSGAGGDFSPAVAQAEKVLANLSKHGVLQQDPITQDGLHRLIQAWAEDPHMQAFTPALTHGDATTSNFIFPTDNSGLVAVDWERHGYPDPAADLGRIQAEVSHSLTRRGGSVAEAMPAVDDLQRAYCQALPADSESIGLQKRARFYRAISTLRIARNGWLTRLERTALVAQAFALLVDRERWS